MKNKYRPFIDIYQLNCQLAADQWRIRGGGYDYIFCDYIFWIDRLNIYLTDHVRSTIYNEVSRYFERQNENT